MKRLVLLLAAMACLGFTVLSAHAQDEAVKVKKEKKVKVPKVKAPKAEKAAKVKPEIKELTISGIIARQEKQGKDDKVSVKYILTDTEGNKIMLPKPKAPKKGKKNKTAAPVAAINLDDYLGMPVTMTGQGTETMKKTQSIIKLKTITTIDKTADAADVQVFPKTAE